MSDWDAERGLRQKAGNEPHYDSGCQSWGQLDDHNGKVKCSEGSVPHERHRHGDWSWGEDRQATKGA